MTQQWSIPAWAAVAVALGVVLLLVAVVALLASARRERRVHREQLAEVGAGTEALATRVRELERRGARAPEATASDERPGYVITALDAEQDGAAPTRGPVPALPAPLFADAVLRESVVQAASLAAGVRRAMAPASRHRSGFEMRREVKRARRRRRHEQRAARRSWGGEPEQGSAA